MCGIASFLSNRLWLTEPDVSWLGGLEASFAEANSGDDLLAAAKPLEELGGRFYELMSFGLHMRLVGDAEALRALSGIR
ncbi:MAG: hypothetical protein AB7D39_15025, partial [Pseudodesulfovibrio sp.]|uniref:hypothetical protein n=1 Tax=Pseudodesulfovibrio sp. TaxID=2035812 RepID=UPI003D0F4509